MTCPRCETPSNHSMVHNHPTSWGDDNTKLLQKMLRDKVQARVTKTGDSFLDAGKCPLCHNNVTVKQEAYATIYRCFTQNCAIKKITVEIG